MAGPSVVVKVLGDLKGLGDAFKGAGTQAESGVARVRGAFGSMLGTLNSTGILGPFGESLATINESMDKIAEHGRTVGGVMLGVGAAAVAVGSGLQAIGSKDQAAHQQLQASVQATGKDYEDYAKSVEEAVKHQEHFGTTANVTQDALRALTQATHDPQKALDLLGTAANVAAAKHEDLSTAATQVGKVYNGNTKLLKEYGVIIDKTTGLTNDGKTATQALADVTAGQASAAADTFMGKLNGIKAHLEDAAATLGQKYGPAITAAGAVMTGLGAAVETVTALQTALTAVTWASLAPYLLIAAAVVALIAVAYLLYKNWDTIWAGIKAVIQTVWQWIQANWPLLLGILLGPIALAAALIYKYWDQIKAGAALVWEFIQKGWESLVGFFTGLPGRLGSIFSGMWDGILNAFRSVLNAVIDLWNELHFTLPKIDLGPLGKIGGGDIGVPHIPHLAQGGLMTSSGLVFAHAGEVISPAPAGAGGGPLVQINGATFNSATDVDMIAKKLEFATRAGLRLT